MSLLILFAQKPFLPPKVAQPDPKSGPACCPAPR